MINDLYHAFGLIFWPVMLWAMFSAFVQWREDLFRAVLLNVIGQLCGYAILEFEANYPVDVSRWAYYFAQFVVISIFMTKIPASRFCGAMASASISGAVLALVYRVSGSQSPLLLFHSMMAVSIVMLLLISGAASGGIGERFVNYIRGRFTRLAFRTRRIGASG